MYETYHKLKSCILCITCLLIHQVKQTVQSFELSIYLIIRFLYSIKTITAEK